MRTIPLDRIDVTVMPNHTNTMTEQEVEAFRKYISTLSQTLNRLELRERVLYGLTLLFVVVDIMLGYFVFRNTAIFVVASFLMNTIIAAASISSYLTYQERSQTEQEYYHAVLGKAYRHD